MSTPEKVAALVMLSCVLTVALTMLVLTLLTIGETVREQEWGGAAMTFILAVGMAILAVRAGQAVWGFV